MLLRSKLRLKLQATALVQTCSKKGSKLLWHQLLTVHELLVAHDDQRGDALLMVRHSQLTTQDSGRLLRPPGADRGAQD